MLHFLNQTVEDADGDYVYYIWADSYHGECGGVCRNFPANLNGRDVGCIYIYIGLFLSILVTYFIIMTDNE